MARAAIDTELESLRDVDGVIGSFVLDEGGDLLGRDLPNLFDAETLGAVGARVCRLLEAMDDPPGSEAHLTLRYAEHKLLLQRLTRGVICVIAGPRASSPALVMASTLVGRRVGRALERAAEVGGTPSRTPTVPAVPRPGGEAAGQSFSGQAFTERPSAGQALSGQAPGRQELVGQVTGAAAPSVRPRFFRGRRVD